MSLACPIIAVQLLALAALWAVVGVLGLRGSLPRNRWVGVRTVETLESDERFRIANRVAAPGLFGAAGILALSAALALGVGGGWAFAFLAGGLVVGLVVIGVISGYGVQAAAALPAPSGCGCCSGDAHSESAPAAATTAQASADTAPEGAGHAADCGTSCGACTLRGVCASEPAQA